MDFSVVLDLKEAKRKGKEILYYQKNGLGMWANLFFVPGTDLRPPPLSISTNLLLSLSLRFHTVKDSCFSLEQASERGSPFLLSGLCFDVSCGEEKRSMIREEGSVSGCLGLDSQRLFFSIICLSCSVLTELTKCLLIVWLSGLFAHFLVVVVVVLRLFCFGYRRCLAFPRECPWSGALW